MAKQAKHSLNSVLREVILEHLLIGHFHTRLWELKIYDVEVLRSEFDAGGYDLVVTHGSITRHVQLKAKLTKGKTASVNMGLALARRPAGCIICFEIDDDLNIVDYLWFGGSENQPLPDISVFSAARHTKANADGYKAERPAHRRVPLSRFERTGNLDGLIGRILGNL